VAQTPEGKVKAAVKKYLTSIGAWFCMPATGGYGTSGVPDIVACWRGQFFAIETKAPGKRKNTTDLQDRQIMGIHKAGGSAIVVDDVSQLEGLFV
jgi:Holliday junction resolvase